MLVLCIPNRFADIPGTQVSVGTHNRDACFLFTHPEDREFSDEERTVLTCAVNLVSCVISFKDSLPLTLEDIFANKSLNDRIKKIFGLDMWSRKYETMRDLARLISTEVAFTLIRSDDDPCTVQMTV